MQSFGTWHIKVLESPQLVSLLFCPVNSTVQQQQWVVANSVVAKREWKDITLSFFLILMIDFLWLIPNSHTFNKARRAIIVYVLRRFLSGGFLVLFACFWHPCIVHLLQHVCQLGAHVKCSLHKKWWCQSAPLVQ
jgi:hypothetical protein